MMTLTWLRPGRTRITNTFKTVKQKSTTLLTRSPFGSFLGLLGLLLILIIVGNQLRQPTSDVQNEPPTPKLVTAYTPGQSPTIELVGRVEENGVVTIVAQAPGIVNKVNVTEGETVHPGKNIVSLSSNYRGGNPATIGRQLAQKNAQFTTETYDLQKDIISKQRSLAEQGNIQAEEMREIGRKSISDTQALISLNETIINSLDANIAALQADNADGSKNGDILQAQQGKAAALGGLAQLRSTLRTVEYSTNEEKAPAALGDTGRDLTLRQLDLQEKSLNLAQEVANLNLKLARLNEAAYYPASPFKGVVEQVFVSPGDSVNPGTPLATIKANHRQLSLVVPVSRDIARQVTAVEPSLVVVNNQRISLLPRHISTSATEGSLGAIFYDVPETIMSVIEGTSNLLVEVPLGLSQITAGEIYIPLDAAYQTQDKAFVYVLTPDETGHTARTQVVTLGPVSGQYVKVETGLTSANTIITTRGVTDGDRVRTE